MSRLKSWTLGLGAGLLGAWWAAGRALSPRYPDIALQAGLELVSFPRRVLAISPHPLDLEWFCGGACFLMKRAGGTVTAAVLTRGEAGGNRANMGQIREKEQAQSGAILGYESIAYLGCKDQQLHAADLAPKLEAVWRQVRPDVVLTFDPRGALPGRLSNPDHAAAGAAVLELLRSGIGNSTRVYLYGTRSPNVAVDITEVVQEKEAAVRAHRSQMAGPDAVAKAAVRAYGRLLRGRTPSFYSETFYRLV